MSAPSDRIRPGETPAQESVFEPDRAFLQSLIEMGITEGQAREALFCTSNQSVEAAVNYFFSSHLNEPCEGSDEPLPSQGIRLGDRSRAPEGEESDEETSPQFKMTFVVNMSLKMGVGKIAAQVAHACLGLYREMMEKRDRVEALAQWDYVGEKKIVLKGDSTEHLQELFEKAKHENVPCYLVHDAGHTQIPAGSVTVLSIFGNEDEVNNITGKLNLL